MTVRRPRLPRVGALTLRTRLTALYGAAFAVAGTVLVVILWLVASTSLDRQPTDIVSIALQPTEASELAGLLIALPGTSLHDGGGAPLRPALARGTQPVGAATPPPGLDAPGPSGALSTAGTPEGAVDQDARTSTLSSLVADANEAAQATTLRTIVAWSVVALVVSLAAAAGTGWVLASRGLAPLHRVTSTARRIAADDLSARIALDGPDDEIRDLADTFDEMLDRLDASFEGQRRFTANASHELRTPLTITRSVLEVAVADPDCPGTTRELAERLLAVNRRQGDLIEGLLALASADLTPPELEPVDLAVLARSVCEESAQTAAASGVTVVVQTPHPRAGAATLDDPRETAPHPPHGCSADPDATLVAGDAVLLERLVRNLVDNAVRYNVPGGWVEVTVACPHELTVENTGPHVPEEEVDRLFEPFRRLAHDGTVADRSSGSTRHPGSGLGLSIVRSVAVAHSGRARARARPDGGLVVQVRLPDGLEDEAGELLGR